MRIERLETGKYTIELCILGAITYYIIHSIISAYIRHKVKMSNNHSGEQEEV